MALALLLVITVIGTGFAVLRLLRLDKGVLGLELAPAVGLASVSVLATAAIAVGLPPPLPGLLVVGVAIVGIGLMLAEREAVRASIGSQYGVAALFGAAAVGVPLVLIATVFGGIEAPLSTHDGAFHVEVIDALRHGHALEGWYPPGLEAGFAALLQVLPWRDSAQGAFELALGLSVLAPLAVCGLCLAVWRDLTIAALAALLSALTYLFGYYTQIWSGWPLEASNLMLLGLWALALEYLERPALRFGVAGGLLLGGIVVTHGSELISAALVLVVVLFGRFRGVDWRRLPLDLGLAFVVALVCAAAYLPTLLGWAAGGGASAVGYAEAGVQDVAAQTAGGGEPLRVFALDAVGIDLPIRLVLVGIGVFTVFRLRTGRHVVGLALVFTCVALAFAFLTTVPLVRTAFAVTFPWGLPYRLFMAISVALAMLAAVGAVRGARWLRARSARWRRVDRLARAGRILVLAWLAVSLWALGVFVSIPVDAVVSYSADDAAAMAFLRAYASPDDVVVNDGYADAGIWAPYKAGVQILLPRIVSSEQMDSANLIILNIADLEASPRAAAAACASNARYAYYGARNSAWQTRMFPPLHVMEASPGLREVFRQGNAVVVQPRVTCG